MKKEVNAIGDICPIPLVKAKEAIKENDSVILMEGYFDVISSQAHGIENCVASCGTSLTPDHVKLLSRYTKSREAVSSVIRS